MLVAVYEVLSPFMTEMREGLAAVQTQMAGMERNLRSMEGKVNHLSGEVIAQKNTATNGFAVLNSSLGSVKEDIKTIKTELESHKTNVAENLEAILNDHNTFDFKLDSLDLKQDRMTLNQGRLGLKHDRFALKMTTAKTELEAKINNITKIQQSTEHHVTLIQSQLTSVNASIRNELRMVKRLLGRNNTECEIETTYSEDLLQSLLNSQTQLELRVLSNITKEMEMSADYHVTKFESALESKLSSVNDSIKNGLRKIEGQIAKNCTGSEMVESLSSVTDRLELVVHNQDILQLELVALSNATKEIRRSADNHVTGIQSQLSSVDAGIRNELMRIGSQIVSRNGTGTEAVEIFSNEEVLERLAGVNTSISGQVNYIKKDLGHISSSVDRVIDRLQECTVSGSGQNCSRQQPKEVTCELNCSQPLLEECTCDTPVEQMPTTNLEEECKVYCDTDCPREVVLRNYTCGGSEGWRRVVYLNMTDPNTNCPLSWPLTSYSNTRSCGRLCSSSRSCDPVLFPVSGGNYTSVCGSIRAYQGNQGYAPLAFYAFHTRQVTTIGGAYVSGVSLTHGSPQQHIWTFAAGASEDLPTERYVCPCDASINITVPPFVGGDYFCESGNQRGLPSYINDPLWDGQGCSSSSTCCSFNNPPYFTKQLPSPTSDPIEARLCRYYSSEDISVEFMELYVK